MEFQDKKAIYLQIAALICEKILLDEYPPAGRLISIRELAVEVEVNPNTIQRTYEYLQQQNIIFTQRGLGYFVSEDAKAKIMTLRKEQFLTTELPQLFKNMYLLGITITEIEKKYQEYIVKL